MSDPFRLNGPQLAQNGLMGELQSEVSAEATPLLRFVVMHAKLLVGCVVVLILAIAAVGGWRWHESSVQRDAEIALGHIRVSTSGAERIAALERIAADIPAGMRLGVELDIAITALGMQDLPKAAAAYGSLYAQDPKGPIGLMAALNQADILQRSNKPAEALAVLDALEKNAPESMRPVIAEGQAISAEQAGDLNRALAGYEAIATSAGNENLGYVQAKIAELRARIAARS